jgi:hypothetical protein
MTARSNQAPVLVLVDELGTTRAVQSTVQILWGISSTATADQLNVQMLARVQPRRIIATTD